tara:strand:- start:70 stop:771 length:702 start_codon:yes stop_codon:yes gene_type:complete
MVIVTDLMGIELFSGNKSIWKHSTITKHRLGITLFNHYLKQGPSDKYKKYYEAKRKSVLEMLEKRGYPNSKLAMEFESEHLKKRGGVKFNLKPSEINPLIKDLRKDVQEIKLFASTEKAKLIQKNINVANEKLIAERHSVVENKKILAQLRSKPKKTFFEKRKLRKLERWESARSILGNFHAERYESDIAMNIIQFDVNAPMIEDMIKILAIQSNNKKSINIVLKLLTPANNL